jgi:hypothetical protein
MSLEQGTAEADVIIGGRQCKRWSGSDAAARGSFVSSSSVASW